MFAEYGLHNILAQIGGLRTYLPRGYEREDDINKIYEIISDEANRARRQMENTLLLSQNHEAWWVFILNKIISRILLNTA